MVIFMGSYSGGDYSSDDDGSQDEESTQDDSQAGLDEYSDGDGGDDTEQDSDSGAGSAGSGTAGGAGTAGGTTGGTGAATGVGAAASGASGTDAGTGTETAEGDDTEDTDEPDDGESDEDEDEQEEQPEFPDIEEPDIESEDDVDEPESEEDTEEDADEEEDDDEEEDETVVVVQEVDALSAMSWGVQPVMKRVEECYGEEIELFYKPAPVREVDPAEEEQKWIDAGQQLGMPVDPSLWDENPPESTDLVNRAFEAAIQQYRGMDYIRALWRQGIAAGRDINDREVLIELASDIGLNQERFEEDLDEAELEAGERGELPFTFMEIQGKPAPKSGRVRYSDFKTQFTFQGLEEQDPQALPRFVEEYGPVATPEVMEVYGVQREDAIQRLQNLDTISSIEIGDERFWTI